MRVLTATAGQTGPRLTKLIPDPLRTDEIRVAIAAASVNAFDTVTAYRSRATFGRPETVGLGYDLAGTVIEVGADVTGFEVGDLVAATHEDLAAPSRAHAEAAVVPATAAAIVPGGLGLQEASTIPLNGLTAAQALDRLGPADDRSLLVTGAAGAVGAYAVALAGRAGFRVTGLARTDDEEFVRAAGAEKLVTELPTLTFDAVVDAAAIGAAVLDSVVDGGAYVGLDPTAPVGPVRDIATTAFFHQPDGRRLGELLDLATQGVLMTRIAGKVALANAAHAYAQVRQGGQRGRWVLLP